MIFEKKVLEHKKCVLVFWTAVLTFFILRRITRDMIKNVIGLYVKYPLFLYEFNEIWKFLTDFRKIINY
jgi:hypothetical protein